MISKEWQFIDNQKRHTQDGCQLVGLMTSVGRGRRPCHAIDVGCGDGIIAFDILKDKKATSVVAIDILDSAVQTSIENLKSYLLSGKTQVYRVSASKFFGQKENWGKFHRFVINPPFYAHGSGRANKSKLDQIARHDKSLHLKLWARGASRLLKQGGQLFCVFPSERLAEAIAELSRLSLEPKELWWLRHDRRKRRFFLRAVLGAKPGLIVHLDHV